jgi:hypothetical protein
MRMDFSIGHASETISTIGVVPGKRPGAWAIEMFLFATRDCGVLLNRKYNRRHLRTA